MAKAYRRQPNNEMKRSGYKMHLRCLRCGITDIRHVDSVPSTRTVPIVSLPTENKE